MLCLVYARSLTSRSLMPKLIISHSLLLRPLLSHSLRAVDTRSQVEMDTRSEKKQNDSLEEQLQEVGTMEQPYRNAPTGRPRSTDDSVQQESRQAPQCVLDEFAKLKKKWSSTQAQSTVPPIYLPLQPFSVRQIPPTQSANVLTSYCRSPSPRCPGLTVSGTWLLWSCVTCRVDEATESRSWHWGD